MVTSTTTAPIQRQVPSYSRCRFNCSFGTISWRDLNLALWRRRRWIVIITSNTFNLGTWMVCVMIVGTSVLVVCPFKDWYFVSVIMLSLDNVGDNHDSLWELDVCDFLWIYTGLISLEQWFTVDAVLIRKFFVPCILGSLWRCKWIMNQWIVYAYRRWATWGWHLTQDEVEPSRYLHTWSLRDFDWYLFVC